MPTMTAAQFFGGLKEEKGEKPAFVWKAIQLLEPVSRGAIILSVSEQEFISGIIDATDHPDHPDHVDLAMKLAIFLRLCDLKE